MKTDWLAEVWEIADDVLALRRTLHRRPELGNREFETAALLEARLQELGCETKRLTETALLGRLRGALPGRCAALRADMDALPIEEATGAAFASETPGRMHACGHDVHMAAALGAVQLLARHRDTLPGEVVVLLQPDEEGDGGAARMIAAGALEGVEAVFGCHVSPELPEGHVGLRYGKFYAAADIFEISLRGKSAHGAEREKGIDALEAACRLVPRLLALPKERPEDRSVVSVGTLRAGRAVNIVPDLAELSGILRTLGPENRAYMRRRLAELTQEIARETGVQASLRRRDGHPGVVNDETMTRFAQKTASELLGPEAVHVLDTATLTTEDFGCFLTERPGTFYHVGAGCSSALHSADFLPKDGAVLTAAALHAALLSAFLQGE